MALGTLLERMFVAISADISELVSKMNSAVAVTQDAAADMASSFGKVDAALNRVEGAWNRQANGVLRLQRMWDPMEQATDRLNASWSNTFEQNTPRIDRFGRSLNMSRNQLANLGFQIQDIGVSLAGGMNPLLIMVQQGSQIAQIYSGSGGGVGALFKDLGGMAVRLWPVAAAVAAIAGGFALLQREINKTSEVQVSFFDTIQATFSVLWERISNFFKPLAEFFGPILGAILDGAVALFKSFGNYIIKNMQIAMLDLQFMWNNFPVVVGAAVEDAVNLVIDSINAMVNAAKNGINGLIGALNNIPGVKIDLLDTTTKTLENWEAGFRATFDELMAERNKKWVEIMGSDPLGDLFSDIKGKAVEIALGRVEEGTKKIGKAAEETGKKLNDNVVTPLMKAADNLAGVFGRVFEDIAETGKFTFGNFINDLNKLLISSVSSSLQKNLSTMFQGMFAGGATGGGNILGDIFTNIFGGFKATGGLVMPWKKAFVAGERGAELIEQDGAAGAKRVMTAGRTRGMFAGAGGGSPVNVTFVMPPGTDMHSFKRSEGQISSMLGRAVDKGRRNQ